MSGGEWRVGCGVYELCMREFTVGAGAGQQSHIVHSRFRSVLPYCIEAGLSKLAWTWSQKSGSKEGQEARLLNDIERRIYIYLD